MDRQSLPTHIVLVVMVGLSALLASCTGIFFQPTKSRYPFVELDRLRYETLTLDSPNTNAPSSKIKAWRFSSVENRKARPDLPTAKGLDATATKGIALQFHGNAENMTSHYRFLAWLLFEGWDVITFDYRGYGDSEGKPADLGGTLNDGRTLLRYANDAAEKSNLPFVVFGQSLGGNIAISSLADPGLKLPSLRLLVIDSSFYSFTSIAREKLSDVWLLWPFQHLGWLLVSNRLSAGPKLKDQDLEALWKSRPAIFLHSKNDPIVSVRQGTMLFESYPGPKVQWTTDEPGHVNTLFADVVEGKSKHREALKIRLLEISGSTSK